MMKEQINIIIVWRNKAESFEMVKLLNCAALTAHRWPDAQRLRPISLVVMLDLELYRLAGQKIAEAVTSDPALVHKHIRATICLCDKAKAAIDMEDLNNPGCHVDHSPFLSGGAGVYLVSN